MLAFRQKDAPVARPAIEQSTQQARRRFAGRLRTDLRAERVILFGSRARGTERPERDHDFIVVPRDYERPHSTRLNAVLPEAIDLLP
jgi:predicted nucleotidyltransferase